MKEIMDTYGEMLLAVVTTVMLGILFWQEIKSPFGMGADVWIRGEYDRNYKKLW